ncbi:MAG: phosphoglucosamine mutase [Gammaproteobacteria bacterium]|nr:MAG: phosphoglucosamine mutase [Gammaproteobacteria bacterium]
MARKYFGTDGVRGRVGASLLTPEFALKLGWAAGRVFAERCGGRPVLIGKDTRISGYLFESALEAGLSAAGVDILLLGPLPTPGIAYLTRTLGACGGVVISASHNPYYDNGIKFLAAGGDKLSDEMEARIEALLDAPLVCQPADALGRARRLVDARGRYIEWCKSRFADDLDLRGLKLVVDCAHGAAYHCAPAVFAELGAEVEAIGVAPNGLNINAGCGATAPQALAERVRACGADAGIALDGDGDRLIMVDAQGRIRDGDALLYLLARDRRARGLPLGGVVGTVMSNLALEQALAALGIPFVRTAVGDRHVMEELKRRGWMLGGETSGHLIVRDKAPCGDGIVAALQVLEVMRRSGCALHALLHDWAPCPQVQRNVPWPRGTDPARLPELAAAVAETERALAGRGRVLLRPSGTEPVLRILLEGEEEDRLGALAEQLVERARAATETETQETA